MKEKYETAKEFVVTHKTEIVVGCVASTLTYFATRTLYRRDTEKFVKQINQSLADNFEKKQGNFTNADGTSYTFPVIVKE